MEEPSERLESENLSTVTKQSLSCSVKIQQTEADDMKFLRIVLALGAVALVIHGEFGL
jgi:hypothetical protein